MSSSHTKIYDEFDTHTEREVWESFGKTDILEFLFCLISDSFKLRNPLKKYNKL